MIDYRESLNSLASEIYEVSEAKGFWDEPYLDDNPLTIPGKLNLIISEVSEATEVHREAYDDGIEDPITDMTPMQEEDFTEELADVVIRVLDLAGAYELDIGSALVAKVEKNSNRPYRHNKRY